MVRRPSRRHQQHQSSRQHHHFERLEARSLLATAVAGVGTGLIANYFSDQEMQNLALTRVDPTVNFDWKQAAPGAGVPADNFSARWTGRVQAQFDETYTFHTQSDEGVALWINGQQIIDNFSDHTFGEDTGTITLKAGELYDIRVDYYDNQFDAAMKLLWSSPSTPKAVIPQTQLYADAGWTSGAWLNTDVGNPSAAGAVSSFGKTYNVRGGGSGTAGTADQFHYLYQTLNGDGVLIAQVAATQGTAAGSEAGVMIRESLAANAAYVGVFVNANGVGSFETRASTGASVTPAAPPAGNSGKYWVKLVRDGNFFRGYTSSTGAEGSWVHFGSRDVPMSRTVVAGVSATSGGNATANNAQFKNVSLVANVPLGAGLDAVRDWALGQIFVDIAKSARTPTGPNLGPAVSFDAQGWPQQDFMTIYATGHAGESQFLNGIYKGSFTGQADLDTWFTPKGSIVTKTYDAATNTTYFEFSVGATPAQPDWYIGMNFRNTRRTAGSPLNSGITNLRVIRPGYDFNTTQVFRTEYLEHLKNFSVLRFMDWTGTNDSQMVHWSDRTKPTDARQSGGRGVAWEYVIQLANMLDKDLWINVPANATDDYVANLATMMRDNLEPDRVIYVEYSNELWNGIFKQFDHNYDAAVAEVAAGGSPLAADGSTNTFYWGWRRVGKRTKEISDVFASVWGQSAINARVRPVLAGHHANPETIRQGIEFIERTYGAPSKYIYGIATAPYFNYSAAEDANPLSVDQILNLLQGSVNGLANRYWQHDTYARRYGLSNMTYEGGPHMTGTANLANKIAAQLDPRMKDLVKSYLNGWYAQGAGLFNWFVAGPTNWTHNGMWGVSNQIDNYTAPKALGNFEVGAAPRQPLTYGIPVPAAFDARAVAGATLPYSGAYLRDPGAGSHFDYFVRVPKAGRYRISFNAGTAGTNEQLRLAVNGSAVRTVTLRTTGSATTFQPNVVGTFDLVEGMNLLHFTSVRETTWNIQTVTVEPAPPVNGTPTVATPAAASNQSADQKTVNLSVLGADNGGESNLLYSWEAVNEQPLSVTFSTNGANASKNTTATFTRAGTYQLRVTISDGLSATTSSVTVVVNQQLASVVVTPTGTILGNGESRQLSAVARDQFGITFGVQPTFVWSIDNDFGSVTSTGLYTAPATELGTATIRATASGTGVSGTATVITQSPRPAENPPNLAPQIEYSYYEGNFNAVPNFETLTPVKSGVVNNITVAPRLRGDNFAFQYTGYVNVPASGTYTFYTNSDDGSKLWVGGQLIVNNDGPHSAREVGGTVVLDAGWHSFKVGYFDASGSDIITASFSGPGVTKQLIPDSSLKRSNRAPTVATLPSANPNPVIGTAAELGVVGNDESGEAALTYTWSTTAGPAGAPAPVFSANGSNAAKNATVTFGRAGTYTIEVAVSDGMLTTTSSVNVIVDQTITAITVAPSNATVKQNRTQQFTASATDQFGNPIASKSLTWSVLPNGGTITSGGLYTAPDTVGNYTVTASAGTVSGSANVSVIEDPAPTVATPAAASPNPTTTGQTQLSVLGADDAGEANLTYTWAATVLPAGAAAPTFSVNGTNAAKTVTAGGLQPGAYTFVATISDGFKTTTSSVDVTVANPATPPTVATAAAATPNPVTGTTTALSVLGADADVGEAGLTYTWSTTGAPPAPVTFSANGTNAAKNVTATFTRAGAYSFLVTISDGTASTTSSVNVTVNQTLTSVAVAPASAIVAQGATQQFAATARDQFAQAMTTQPGFTWSIGGSASGATVSPTGLYTAPTTGTPTHTVVATVSGGSVSGSADVTVTTATPSDTFTASQDIGNPGFAGSYSKSGDTHTVRGGGADIWGRSDQFHYAYKQLTGDGQIVARVVSVQNTQGFAKAGVMFRELLTPDSRHASFSVSPDGWTRLVTRLTEGGTSTTQGLGDAPAPYGIKLVRAGNTFTGYRSPDGVNWTQIGQQTIPDMPATLYVGLIVNARHDGRLNTSTFDNVSVTAAAPLATSATIGSTPRTSTTAASALVDGSLATYFESATPNGAWVGVDFGSDKTITQINYAPRKGFQGRMIGGTFQVSDTADFSGNVVDLFVIKKAPKNGAITAQAVSTGKAFRYVRYLAPDGSFGNIAETSFVGF